MARYLMKRALSGLVTLFIFQTIIFFAVQFALPGDYASQFTLGRSTEEVHKLRESLGLHLPLGQQYLIWLSSLFTGTPAYYRLMVLDTIRYFLPGTLLVFGSATFLAFVLGHWLGRLAAWRKPGLLSDSVTLGAVLLYASFPPWLAIVFAFLFTGRYRLAFPLDPTRSVWRHSTWSPQTIILYLALILFGLALVLLVAREILQRRWRNRLPLPLFLLLAVAGLLGLPYALGFGRQAQAVLQAAWLPILVFTLLSFGEILILTRTSMAEVLHEEYVNTARAKGLPDSAVRDRHAARTALLPVVSKLVVSLPYLMGGVVMVETATGWSGLGSSLYYAVISQNMPGAMAAFLVIGLFTLAASLALEVLQVYIDPRLRPDSRG